MLIRVRFEKHNVGVCDNVLWLKIERHQIAKAGPRLVSVFRRWIEPQVCEATEPIQGSFYAIEVCVFLADTTRYINLRFFDEIHIPGALLISWRSPCEKLLSFDSVNDNAEPGAIFTNDA